MTRPLVYASQRAVEEAASLLPGAVLENEVARRSSPAVCSSPEATARSTVTGGERSSPGPSLGPALDGTRAPGSCSASNEQATEENDGNEANTTRCEATR